ncbi:hypothetical protein BaRGS_00030539 [Batillaria attramentaria]|uniref:Uncharacterized protein n=1 Tax=Batillaria attramentaria TaxID=370345 RepID=A0ABD0JSR7_9CAEN
MRAEAALIKVWSHGREQNVASAFKTCMTAESVQDLVDSRPAALSARIMCVLFGATTAMKELGEMNLNQFWPTGTEMYFQSIGPAFWKGGALDCV